MAVAFQPNAFQHNAFQTTVAVVAGQYFLGSPGFATPAVGEILAAPSYSLGSPTSDSPVLGSHVLLVTAANYYLGSPTYPSPALRQFHALTVSADYSLGSPDFGTAAGTVLRFVEAGPMSLGSPTFAAPSARFNYHFSAAAYSLASPDFALVPSLGVVEVALGVSAYWLGSPLWHYPLMNEVEQVERWPAFYADELDESQALLATILQQLMATVPTRADGAYAARRAVGLVLGNARQLLIDGELGDPLRACWDAAVAAGASFDGMERLRAFIAGLTPENAMPLAIVETCLIFTISEQSTIASGMTFVSSADVQSMILRVGSAFEQIATIWADQMPAAMFESITTLSAAIMQHLNLTELQLPRIVAYSTALPMPALVLAYSIYDDTSRWEEIVAENGVIHPAFCPMNLQVLSQ